MSFRRKLLLVFVAVTLFTNGISLGLLYWLSERYFFDGYRAKLLSISSSVAALLDGDALKSVRSAADEGTPEYRRLHQTLRRVRDANRRDDTRVKRVFTVMRAPADANLLLVGVDAEEGAAAAHPGEAYRALHAGAIDFTRPVAETAFSEDEFGRFLRSSAPVRDSAGQVTGVLIVEAEEQWVEFLMRHILYSGAISLLLAAAVTVPAGLFLSSRASRPLAALHKGVEAIGRGDFSARVPEKSRDEFGAVARAVNAMAEGLGERERIKSAFARYVSQQVLDTVLTSGSGGVSLSGDRRRITVLFCDIRGFSTISERLPPERVVEVLNEYFETMVDVVFRNQGTLDKFLGDGLMVIFGAPADDPYQEEHALRTALEMQRELRKLTQKWESDGIRIRIGVGINSGPAVVGNIGSTRRMEYTAIGDTVNLASRLESATKDLGVEILVSEYTYAALRGAFEFRHMGPVQVRGRSEAVLTYTVVDPEREPARQTAGA